MANAASTSTLGGKLLVQRLDIFFMQAHRLPQSTDSVGITLRRVLLIYRGPRRTIGVRRTRFVKELLFGRKLVAQDLATDIIATLLSSGVDLGETGGRRTAHAGRRADVDPAGWNVEIVDATLRRTPVEAGALNDSGAAGTAFIPETALSW